MDIRLVEGQYKSITSLEWNGIPRLAVITGANGSGKTQLLELIARSVGVISPPPGYNPRVMDHEAFNARLHCSESIDAQNTVFLRSHWEISDSAATFQQVRSLANDVWNSQLVPDQAHMTTPRNTQWDLLWDNLVRDTGIRRGEFSREQFDAALPPNFMLMIGGFTSPAAMPVSIPLLFVSYAARVYYLKKEGLADEAIVEKLGALPWEAVNRALQLAGLHYKMVPPSVGTESWIQTFELSYRVELHHLQTGAAVSASALSSGERVIFLTAIWSFFFNQEALNSRTALLLLDEPDAHLHPALTSMFLRVIRDELVERRGIRVIATTHSPSTVALTNEESLFVMSPLEPRLRQVLNKWDATAHLTYGLVTVGSHTKVVFVEDKDDVGFYQALQSVLCQGMTDEVGFDKMRLFNFVPASVGRNGGGKNTVILLVSKIENTQIAGIVDRDEDADPPARVYVGTRRHLESYLLDPLFVYALLMDENITGRPNFAPELDHRHSKSLKKADAEVLQRIAEGMVAIYAEFAGFESGEAIAVRYLGGAEVLLPQWLLKCDMKKLIEPLRKRFGVDWNNEYLIRKYEVLGVIPLDLVEILLNIQSA